MMRSKMTYEKLFKALNEGKKIKFKGCHEDSIVQLGEYGDLVDEVGDDDCERFVRALLTESVQNFEVIEETNPYDMTYGEALIYMLENPGVHRASNDECVSSIYRVVNKDEVQIEGVHRDGSVKRNVIIFVSEMQAKWRKEPDLEQGDNDVSQGIKKTVNDFLEEVKKATESAYQDSHIFYQAITNTNVAQYGTDTDVATKKENTENWQKALDIFIKLKSHELAMALQDNEREHQHLISLGPDLITLGIYPFKSDFFDLERISPCFKSEKDARQAIKDIGEENIINMFKIFGGV